MPVQILMNTVQIALGKDHTCAISKHNTSSHYYHAQNSEDEGEYIYNTHCFGSSRYEQAYDFDLGFNGSRNIPLSVTAGV